MAVKVVAVNRKAHHDYQILDRVEAGLVLTGTEIKSVRAGRVNLRESHARPDKGEVWLLGVHIAQYEPGSRANHEPQRSRKLLLHKGQIRELAEAVNQKGLTVVPLRLYLKDDLAKVELAVVRGRKAYDKRQAIAEREAERQIARSLRREGR